jgi:acid phosphatase type 7
MSTEPKTITMLLALVLVAAPGFSSRGDQPPAASEDVVFVGAGDIANCDLLTGARATAALLDGIEGTVFTLGDHAYLRGTDTEFRRCYDPTWGRHKARTRPTPGNHDYLTSRGRPYFEYFGAAAGPDERGYYSFDLGAWHIISLNSSVPAALSTQAKWLRDDLAAHRVDCVLAYWHAPVYSSGPHAPDPTMRDTWSILYKAGADVVLNGHDHIYERFAPQDDKGKPDAEHGIREFIAGTGGGGVYKFGKIAANSEVHDNSTYGVLKLTLSPGKYAWEFIPMPGSRFTDTGTASCSPVVPSAPGL